MNLLDHSSLAVALSVSALTTMVLPVPIVGTAAGSLVGAWASSISSKRFKKQIKDIHITELILKIEGAMLSDGSWTPDDVTLKAINLKDWYFLETVPADYSQ